MQPPYCRALLLLIYVLAKGIYAQPPMFTSPSYSVQVQETAAKTVKGVASPRPPDGFLTVRCINGFNSSVGITYTIGQVSPFVLNSTTGSFSVTHDLVYGTQNHSYNFSVWCHGNLSPNLSSNASVTISVIEVDKYMPVLTPSYIFLTVNETTPIGTVMASTRRDVGALSVYNATDMDVGPQGVLRYTLYYLDPRFAVDMTFGTLSVQQSLGLDYINATSFINLKVYACDPHVCSNELEISIIILRQNDHYPMFSQEVYSVTCNDSTPPGQVIPSICTDQDIVVGALQGVVFLNTTPGVFLLNSSTGVLTTNITMEYRRARGYTVVLLCSDTGGLTNTSTVYVSITPPPNYKPLKFLDPFFIFYISRAADDLNPGDNNIPASDENDWATLTYHLENNTCFTIDENGTLQNTTSWCDYMCDVMVLNASVTDGVYTNSTLVYIVLIANTTDQPPSQATPTVVSTSPNGTSLHSTSPSADGMGIPTPSTTAKAARTPPTIPPSCFTMSTTIQATPTSVSSMNQATPTLLSSSSDIALPIILTLVCGVTLVVVILLFVCLICCHCWRLGHKDESKSSPDHQQPLGRLSSVAFVNTSHDYGDEHMDVIKPSQGNVMVVPVPIHEQQMFGATTFHPPSFVGDKATSSIFHTMAAQHAAISVQPPSESNDDDDDDVDSGSNAGRGHMVGPVLKALLQKWDSTEKVLAGERKDNISMTNI